MPNRRKLFQISLITLGLIIVFLTYFTNLERNQQEDFKVSENTSDDERFLEEGLIDLKMLSIRVLIILGTNLLLVLSLLNLRKKVLS